jgi:hypothetical protein
MMGCTCSWSGVNLTFIGTRSFTINTDVLLMTVECSTLCWSVVQCAALCLLKRQCWWWKEVVHDRMQRYT